MFCFTHRMGEQGREVRREALVAGVVAAGRQAAQKAEDGDEAAAE